MKSEEFESWQNRMVELIPKLNYDAIIELSYHLAFEAELRDKLIWRTLEQAALDNFHLYELKHICQLQWAFTQLKPKIMSTRFSNMLHQVAGEHLEKGLKSSEDFHHILQGFRNRKT